ncbi:MAG: HAD-IC family P-type ATPase, partial [Clostridia bacterium]|nr:HAD-IC family P-type ATPase [Clostridia bacterium]
VERFSEHPLGDAILREVKRRNLKTKPVQNFLALPGKGAHGEVNGNVVKVGNKMMFPSSLPTRVQNDLMRQEEEGNTVVIVGKDNDIFGLIVLTDKIRKESFSVIRSLKEMGIKRTVMLTGDSPAAAGAIAQKIGVDTVFAGMLPQEKVTKIQKLKNSRSVVMMVGDGINDAPALAAADVSIAMGVAGTDAALEAADIALMADDLGKLPFAVELSRQSIKVIKQNIGFALGIKLLALLAVFPGWLTLWVAIMADMGANVLVTLNGMRLVRYKRRLPKKMPEVACACSST